MKNIKFCQRVMQNMLICGIILIVGAYPAVAAAPAIQPATSNYLVGAFYMPAWRVDQAQNSWIAFDHVPDRKPLLGYYNDNSPAAWDWQIKWALEHGVNFFIYDWFRCAGGATVIYHGEYTNCTTTFEMPASDETTLLGSGLHEGFFKSKYQSQIKFTIMPTVRLAWKDIADLRDNVMPYWIDRYFKRENYLKVDEKPVLFLFDIDEIANRGGPQALMVIRNKAKAAGFPDVIILGKTSTFSLRSLKEEVMAKEFGFDYLFQYVTFPYTVDGNRMFRPTEEQAIRGQLQGYQFLADQHLVEHKTLPFVMTASPAWDRHYINYETDNPNEPIQNISANGYKQVLQNIKTVANRFPANELGRKMILVDAWSEYLEGHYIGPTVGTGFGYLRSIREVLSNKNNTPDYTLPSDTEIESFSTLYSDYAKRHIRKYNVLKTLTFRMGDAFPFIEINDYGFGAETAGQLSVGGWFKAESLDSPKHLMYKQHAVNVMVNPNGSGYCEIGTRNNSWGTEGTKATWPAGKFTVGSWHHVICVYTGTNVHVYVDGVKLGSSTPAISGLLRPSYFHLYLGRNQGPDKVGFQGNVGNIRVSDRALSGAEIKSLVDTTRPDTNIPGDIIEQGDTPEDQVNLFDYNKLIVGFGNPYTIFDYNRIISNFGK